MLKRPTAAVARLRDRFLRRSRSPSVSSAPRYRAPTATRQKTRAYHGDRPETVRHSMFMLALPARFHMRGFAGTGFPSNYSDGGPSLRDPRPRRQRIKPSRRNPAHDPFRGIITKAERARLRPAREA